MITGDTFKLLAYPAIDPPYKLLAKGLLYADQLGTLTPQGSHPDLDPALERGLYQPLSPWELLDDDTEFLESLAILIQRLRSKQYLDPTALPEIIRAGKLPDVARAELVRSGAAEELRGGDLAGDPALVLATLSLTAQMVAAKNGAGWLTDTDDRRIHENLSVADLLALRDRESDDLIRRIKETANTMADPNVYHGQPGRLQKQLDDLGYQLAKSAGSNAGLMRVGVSGALLTIGQATSSAGLAHLVGDNFAAAVVGIGSVGQSIIARRRDHKHNVILSNLTG